MFIDLVKSFCHFIYQFLFIDQDKQKLSHSKFWSHISYGCLCFCFTYAVIYGTTVEYMLWIVFGIVGVGNRTVLKMITGKSGNGNQSPD